jgi:GTP-binding protein
MQIRHVEFIKSAGRVADFPPDLLPEIAFVGRSNVGKSSLINSLFKQRKLARVSRTPGKTQHINFFKVRLLKPRVMEFYCVDLPGYGYAKAPADVRARWEPLIETYLRERRGVRRVIALLDIRRDPSPLDHQLRDWIEPSGIRVVWVVTKADLLPLSKRRQALERIRRALKLAPTDLLLSASVKTGEGRKELLSEIERAIFVR